jgi:putative ABC transport system permease protein
MFTEPIKNSLNCKTFLAWYAMHVWLQGFAYRVSLNPLFFPLAGFAALAIALATVAYQSLKAAFANPADSLRYE